MTLDEAIKHCEEVKESCERGNPKKRSKLKCASEHRQLAEWLRELKALRAETRWIPMIRREPTEEEKAEYFARNGEELCYMLDNEMPLNEQEILVSSGKFVSEDVFNEDFYNFENHDIENVDAWRPLPRSYEKESEGEDNGRGES